ncbi:MAG: hypothetical protein KGK02_08235 [Rhodospirillales bacterium]|nr:hypothetical protein [Rhodospirillales bacterium]
MKDLRSALPPAAAMVSLLALAACGGAYIVNGTTTMTHATGITKAGADSALRTTNVVATPAPASADNTASAGSTVSTPSSGSTGGGINFTVVNTTGPVSTANKAGEASTVNTPAPASTVNTPAPANTGNTPAPANTGNTPAPANTGNTPGPANTVSAAAPANTVNTPGPAGAMPADPTSFCPQVAVLQQAQTVTLFLPGRSDVASQVSTAEITSVSGDCVPQKKHKTTILEVKFTNNFLADNGPANNSQPITLPWFVAITKGSQIIEKKDYQITLTFNGNMSVAAASSKPVKIELPAVPDSAGLQILTGFEMTPDQLSYAAAHPSATP